MSLAPRWHSTLFGAYFFTGAYWSAIVMMALVAVATGRGVSGEFEHRYRDALHDIGKLFFACSVFWVYLLFSQYIVIWYGDIPAETFFVVPRVQHLPWGALGWSALHPHLGDPVLRADGQRPKRTPAILDRGLRARTDRDVDRALRSGGAVAVATRTFPSAGSKC